MRNKLRCFWLYLVNEWQHFTSRCYYCGKRGASVCSLLYPKRLCDSCSTAASRRAVARTLERKLNKFVK